MEEHQHQHHINDNQTGPENHVPPRRGLFIYWVVGLGSLLWLLLRSGFKPRRLAYPCQQTALATGLSFLAYLAALAGSATLLRRLKKVFSMGGLALLAMSLLLTALLQTSAATPAQPVSASPALTTRISPTSVSDVFAVINVPAPLYDLDGGDIPSGVSAANALHDDGVDALVNLMESHGDYFYKTAAHPSGLFAANDVVVIKVNNQWDGRNGTNSDVVKGVIYKLVSHPDGFTGAVIVAENSQNHNTDWYNELSGNNSQFQNQSYQEVVQAFVSQSRHVCISDWKGFWQITNVNDFDAGDNNNGYVLEDANGTATETGHKRLSYPKFQVNCNGLNLSVSMKKGLWNGSTFDNTRLKMINLPVLKRHNSAWGTISIKNYLGFMTTYDPGGRWISPGYKHCWMMGQMDNTDACTAYTNEFGLVGFQMAHIRRADLNLVDAIWVNPRDNAGYHGEARRQDVLLSSRDPFAVDYYASEEILYPLVQTYGSTSTPEQARASTHGGWFRNIQLRNENRLRTEGITNTINMDDSMSKAVEEAQFSVYVADASAAPSPTLTLTTPNGSESWIVGTQHQIQWTSTNLSDNVKLEYSTNGFSTANTIISSTANDGAYTWTIPNNPSTTARVRVSSVLTPTINDASNANFTIVAPPSPTVTLTSPNGGQVWTIGTQQPIQWTSANLTGNVKLEYSTNNFSTAQTIIADTANDNAYTWTIPNVPTTTARVRVSSVLSSTINDTSNANFTIAGPHTFTDSFKSVSRVVLEGGEVITYTIVLYEQTQATLRITDTIPAPLIYQTGSVQVVPTWKLTATYTSGSIRWSGTVTGTQPVTITFRAQVPITTTSWFITNHAQMSRNSAAPLDKTASALLNGVLVYLPIVSKN